MGKGKDELVGPAGMIGCAHRWSVGVAESHGLVKSLKVSMVSVRGAGSYLKGQEQESDVTGAPRPQKPVRNSQDGVKYCS